MIALIDLALVIVLVNLGQVEDILGDELILCRVRYIFTAKLTI